MPRVPPPANTSEAAARAWRAPAGLPRFSGIWPVARNSQRVIGFSKYSALATKATGSGLAKAKKIESMNERWLAARITPSPAGTLSTPSTSTSYATRSGRLRAALATRYPTGARRFRGLNFVWANGTRRLQEEEVVWFARPAVQGKRSRRQTDDCTTHPNPV